MPELLPRDGYRFFFYAADRREPVHVHIASQGKEAKYWLQPFVRLDYARGYRGHELTEIEKIIADHLKEFINVWNDYFKSRA